VITTVITVALTNYERQKKWRDKNRAIFNLRRRNARKNGGDTVVQSDHGRSEPEKKVPVSPPLSVDELRQLMEKSSEEPDQPVTRIYKDDYGRLITERQWNTLQTRKTKAKDGGYEIDEYTQ